MALSVGDVVYVLAVRRVVVYKGVANTTNRLCGYFSVGLDVLPSSYQDFNSAIE